MSVAVAGRWKQVAPKRQIIENLIVASDLKTVLAFCVFEHKP